jgi:hypothetical protein
MGVPAEMNKKPAIEKPLMHAGGGIGAPHEHASIQVSKPEKKSEVEEKLFNKTKEKLLNWTEKCENWISRMEEKITTLNMSDETKARIEKRAEDAKKMVEEMRSKIENARNLADLRNVTKDARMLWANLSKEMRLIAFEHAVYHLEKMIERMKEIAGKLKEKGVDVSGLEEKIKIAGKAAGCQKEATGWNDNSERYCGAQAGCDGCPQNSDGANWEAHVHTASKGETKPMPVPLPPVETPMPLPPVKERPEPMPTPPITIMR